MKKILILSPITILIIMLASSFLLMLGAARNDSAIMDELAHIPASYGYVKYLDYRLNPEHPPLVKILAGIPLLFQNLNFPTTAPSWTTDINGQWETGTKFLYESGNNADRIIFWARFAPMLLTLLLIFFVYFFAKKLMGRWWALLPALFTAFSPNFLAHGHYVTTDIGATLGIIMAIYFFNKSLFSPSIKNLIFAGIFFGIAQLMKFSTVLLIPYFILIIIIFYIINTAKDWRTTSPHLRFKRFAIRLFRYLRALIAIFIIGYAVVYLIYFATTINYPVEKQLSDAQATLQSFGNRTLANLDIWMAGNKIFRPIGQYFLGILMVMQRSAGGNTAYFLGDVTSAGWKYYFPIVFLMKEALPILIAVLAALIFASWNILKSFRNAFEKFKEYLITNFDEFSMLIFIIIYWVYTLQTTLNIGFRHLMPVLPLTYILTASAIKKWTASTATPTNNNPLKKIIGKIKHLLNASAKIIFISILLIWLIAGTIKTYPYFLSRFNELSGGTANGYKFVVDSNFDWGQDLKRLKTWTDNNLSANEKIAIDYFGGGSPKYYLGNKAVTWTSAQGNPKNDGIEWLAVSVNTLQGVLGKPALGFTRNPQDEYLWLENPYSPYARAGTSIFIYKLY